MDIPFNLTPVQHPASLQLDFTTQTPPTRGPWLQGGSTARRSHPCLGAYSNQSALSTAPPISGPSFFGVQVPAFHAALIFGGTLILQAGTQPAELPAGIHQSRLSFLGACSYPGRGCHITVTHKAFSPADTPVSFEISQTYNNHGLLSPAPSSTVTISSMTLYFLESFSKGQNKGSFTALNASDQFNHFTRSNVIPALMILSAVSTGWGFSALRSTRACASTLYSQPRVCSAPIGYPAASTYTSSSA